MATSTISLSAIEVAREALNALPHKISMFQCFDPFTERTIHIPRTLKVTFGGELAEKFGAEFRWQRQGANDQIPDAIKTISVNCPDFQSHLYECDRIGQMFAVSIDGEWCADDLTFASYLGDARSIHVEPLAGGEGGNLVKGLLGAALIGVGIAAGATGILGVPGATLIIMGSSMLLSAAVGALMSRPISKNDDEKETRKNSYFSGSSQNAAGRVIPRLYGTSIKELNGVPYPVGRRIPCNVLSFSINYVELQEDDD
jgi:predicted phage tail protein